MFDADVLGGKTAGCHGGEGVADGIEKIHPPEQQDEDLDGGNENVNLPKDPGGMGNPGGQFVGRRARHLRFIKLHSSHPEEGKKGHGK